jgi:hypothetical protein
VLRMLVINWHLFAHRRLTIANGCCNSQWKACAFDVCVADCCSYSANDFPQTAFVVESESSSALSSVVIFRLQRFLFRFTEVASRILFGPGFGSGGVLKVTIVPSFGPMRVLGPQRRRWRDRTMLGRSHVAPPLVRSR